MEKKNNAIIKKVILIVCIVAFLVSSVFVAKYFIDKHNNGNIVDDLTGQSNENPTEQVEKPDYSSYVDQNPETVGWIKIPDTNINFPVVQTVDNEYYMTHNFESKKDKRGAIFMDYRNLPSDLDSNTIIYGHAAYYSDNVTYDGTVFSDLNKYEDLEFYKEHPVVEFNTLDSYYKWKIYAVFISNQGAQDDNGYIFNYIYPHNFEPENIKGYVAELNKRTLYFTGVDIQEGDKFLTLQTCNRSLDMPGYRAGTSLVVVARMVRPGEDANVDTSGAYINENPKYPQLYYKKHGINNPFANDAKWYPTEVSRDGR